MKKLIAVAVLAMMILGTSVSANEWNKIRIGVEGAYPPFSKVAEGRDPGRISTLISLWHYARKLVLNVF